MPDISHRFKFNLKNEGYIDVYLARILPASKYRRCKYQGEVTYSKKNHKLIVELKLPEPDNLKGAGCRAMPNVQGRLIIGPLEPGDWEVVSKPRDDLKSVQVRSN